jgi:hypothetical protein
MELTAIDPPSLIMQLSGRLIRHNSSQRWNEELRESYPTFLILFVSLVQAYGDENNDKVIQSGARRIINMVERLGEWYRSLPDPLLPLSIVFPSQLKLQ